MSETPIQETPPAAAEPRPPLLRRVILWVTSTTVLAALLSLVVHLVLALVAAGVFLQRAPGARASAPDSIELAVVTETELRDIEAATEFATDDAPSFSELDPERLLPPPEFDTAVVDPTLSLSAAGPLSPIGGAGEGLAESMDLSGASVGEGAASFFGVEARGSRFAYIVDVSGSMAGPKLAALQNELRRSVGGLLEHSTFIVIAFSSDSNVLGGSSKWRRATERAKALIDREVRGLTEGGGTNPMKAFETVFDMRPRPDAIYFMTDGLFSESIAGAVSLMNRSGPELTPIHCISFVSREAESLMKSMANSSGGTYTHIPGPRP